MTTRSGSCACGNLTVRIAGDPDFVIACHCLDCQRRTGSVFGVGAYYRREMVKAAGVHREYVRDGQDGRKLRFHFCPDCGSTVFWELDLRPDHFGVAVGAMADPTFPTPTRSVWEQSRHHWLEIGDDVAHFPKQSSAAGK